VGLLAYAGGPTSIGTTSYKANTNQGTTLTCRQSLCFIGSYGLVQPVQPYDHSIITCRPKYYSEVEKLD
jgi:hypothetical protein